MSHFMKDIKGDTVISLVDILVLHISVRRKYTNDMSNGLFTYTLGKSVHLYLTS